jgi:uncharacterized protein YndB with AHSA1/START domain
MTATKTSETSGTVGMAGTVETAVEEARAGGAQAAGDEHARVMGPGTVRLERLLPGPIERVWAYLTDPAKRGEWLARGEMEPRVGGSVALRFQHADLSAEKIPPEKYRQKVEGATVQGTVTRWEPPRVLSFTWGEGSGAESEVSFEATPRGAEVLLVLTHRRLATRPGMVGVAGGWHSHLDVLADRLHGREPRGFWSAISRLEPVYEKRVPADAAGGGASKA